MNRPSNVGIRVNLTLDREVVAVLDRIAKATGTGRATMVREVLTDGLPGLRDMATALEMAQKKNADAFKFLAKGIDAAVSEGQQLSLDIKRKRRAMVRKKKA